jgi:predicted transcriptional regulator
MDILKTLLNAENDGSELKRTPLQQRCGVNYTVIVEYTDRLEKNGLIKRDSHGFYTLTSSGKEYANQANMSESDKTEVIKTTKELMNMIHSQEGDPLHETLQKLRKLLE